MLVGVSCQPKSTVSNRCLADLAGQTELSIDLDRSSAAVFGSMSFVPYLCQAMSAMLAITLAVIWGRNLTMTSSNEEIHWSLL